MVDIRAGSIPKYTDFDFLKPMIFDFDFGRFHQNIFFRLIDFSILATPKYGLFIAFLCNNVFEIKEK